MKKLLFSMAAASFMLVAMVGCKGGGSDPKSVAMSFMDKIKKQDFEGAAQYATKDSRSALDMMKSAASMAKMFDKDGKGGSMDFGKEWEGKKVEYTDPKIEGDNAKVSLMVDGKEQMPISLKKEDGSWKVAFDKSTLMQQGADKIKESGATTPNMEDLNGMTDSIKKALEAAGPALDSLKKVMDQK